MNNYYKIISKQEFTALFRFGKIPLGHGRLISESSNKGKLESALFEQFMELAYFDGDEEYLIIKFINKPKAKKWLDIQDLLEIIP